jgi:hypothetical protein
MVFSRASNNSDAVVNEIENAQSLKKTIIPLRIDDTDYSDTLDYYLKSKHHVNAFGKSAETAARELLPFFEAETPLKESTGMPAPAPSRKRTYRIVAVIIVLAAALLTVYLVNRRGGDPVVVKYPGKTEPLKPNRIITNPGDKIKTIQEQQGSHQQADQKIEVTVTSNPYTILAGATAEIRVFVITENQVPLPEAKVTLSAGGGYFEVSKNLKEVGTTNSQGVYITRWTAPNPAGIAYGISVKASKQHFVDAEGKVTVNTQN